MTAERWSRDDAHARLAALEAAAKPRRFETLLQRHESRLRRVAYGMLAHPSRVDDVLQEALVRAYRKLPVRFETEQHEAAWLYRIVPLLPERAPEPSPPARDALRPGTPEPRERRDRARLRCGCGGTR